MYPVPFDMDHTVKNKESPSLFGLQIMLRKIPFLAIYYLGNFDDLIQSGYWVIPKLKFGNLCKPIHGVMIIPVSSTDCLNLETVEKKGKELQKIEYLKNEEGVLDKIKSIFHNFWNASIP